MSYFKVNSALHPLLNEMKEVEIETEQAQDDVDQLAIEVPSVVAGSWTPTLTSIGGGSATVNSSSCEYVVFDNSFVFITGFFSWNSISYSGGGATLTSLPFIPANDGALSMGSTNGLVLQGSFGNLVRTGQLQITSGQINMNLISNRSGGSSLAAFQFSNFHIISPGFITYSGFYYI